MEIQAHSVLLPSHLVSIFLLELDDFPAAHHPPQEILFSLSKDLLLLLFLAELILEIHEDPTTLKTRAFLSTISLAQIFLLAD